MIVIAEILRGVEMVLRGLIIAVLMFASMAGQAGVVEWDGTLRRIRVPILMYHYVSTLPDDADDIRIGLTVTPPVFRQQMAYLHDNGYTTISLYQLYDALMTGEPLPAKPVVLTFDDGYRDHYQEAFPILREFGFTGTFFVITETADTNNPAHLSWSQIAEMAAAGMHMESHSKSHPDMRERDHDFLVYQVLGSLESLEAHTGVRARMFCYPVGRYDPAVLAVLEQANVLLAVTTQSGVYHTTSDPLELPRVRVTDDMVEVGFQNVLAG